jgi:hypothetical protein
MTNGATITIPHLNIVKLSELQAKMQVKHSLAVPIRDWKIADIGLNYHGHRLDPLKGNSRTP